MRKALLAFLSWYLPLLPFEIITPHLPILLLSTSSALSHIFPEIRVDACRIVSLLLEVAPQHVVSDWPSPQTTPSSSRSSYAAAASAEENTILQGLRLAAGLGGKSGEGGTMGQTMLPTSKLVVLKTILGFVQTGLRKQGLVHGSAFKPTSHSSSEPVFPTEIFTKFESDLGRRTQDPLGNGTSRKTDSRAVDIIDIGPEMMGSADGWLFEPCPLPARTDTAVQTSRPLDTNTTTTDSSVSADNVDELDLIGEALSLLYFNLHPLLLSSLLESATPAFGLSQHASGGKTTPEVHLELCSTISDLVLALASPVLESPRLTKAHPDVKKQAHTIVTKLTPYFPFGGFSSSFKRSTSSLAETQISLSVTYSSLVVLLQPSPDPLPLIPKNASQKQIITMMDGCYKNVKATSQGKGMLEMRGVLEWLEELLVRRLFLNLTSMACRLTLSNSQTISDDALQPSVNPVVFNSILPVIWSLMTTSPFTVPKAPLNKKSSKSHDITSDQDESIPERMLEALLVHEAGSKGATKKLATEFICRMSMVSITLATFLSASITTLGSASDRCTSHEIPHSLSTFPQDPLVEDYSTHGSSPCPSISGNYPTRTSTRPSSFFPFSCGFTTLGATVRPLKNRQYGCFPSKRVRRYNPRCTHSFGSIIPSRVHVLVLGPRCRQSQRRN